MIVEFVLGFEGVYGRHRNCRKYMEDIFCGLMYLLFEGTVDDLMLEYE